MSSADPRNPSFLYLWFSHPLFDQQVFNEVTLFDDAGQPIPMGANGLSGSAFWGPETDKGGQGWSTRTLCPQNTPPTLTVRLRYTIGRWEGVRQFKPDEQVSVALGQGSQFNAMGQDAKGRAFFSISIDKKQDSARQFGVVAVTKDGRELLPTGGSTSGGVGEAVQVQQFGFAVPLADVARFQLSTRAIMTMEFAGVCTRGEDTGLSSRWRSGSARRSSWRPGGGTAAGSGWGNLATKEYEAGVQSGGLEYEAAKSMVEILEAELTGNPVHVAEIRLRAAHRRLDLVTKQTLAGHTTRAEQQKAEGEVAIAEAQWKEAVANQMTCRHGAKWLPLPAAGSSERRGAATSKLARRARLVGPRWGQR